MAQVPASVVIWRTTDGRHEWSLRLAHSGKVYELACGSCRTELDATTSAAAALKSVRFRYPDALENKPTHD